MKRLAVVLSLLLFAAQIDPRQMAGIPRPVNDLPDTSISVRLIRGSLTNNITGHPVELHFANGRVTKVNTDDAGRAQFDKLPAGQSVKASADVDGEHLESQDFLVPSQGGIRLMLVATDKNAKAAPSAPAVTGAITLGENSRIVLEPGDDDVAVYYMLELVNNSTSPVDPKPPFSFDMPKGAQGTTILDGANVAQSSGGHVSLSGPVPPGRTMIQLVAEMPTDTGTLNISQAFPAQMDRLTILVRKLGDTKLESPSIERQQDFPNEGQVVIGAMGGTIPPGKPIELRLIDMPHHSTAPRYTALGLASAVVLAGVWFGTRKQDAAASADVERKRLVARREKLFGELVKLERERRSGRSDERSERKRDELLAQLEHVYGALDDPDRAGATA